MTSSLDELGLVSTLTETQELLEDEEYTKSLEELIDNMELAPFHRLCQHIVDVDEINKELQSLFMSTEIATEQRSKDVYSSLVESTLLDTTSSGNAFKSKSVAMVQKDKSASMDGVALSSGRTGQIEKLLRKDPRLRTKEWPSKELAPRIKLDLAASYKRMLENNWELTSEQQATLKQRIQTLQWHD